MLGLSSLSSSQSCTPESTSGKQIFRHTRSYRQAAHKAKSVNCSCRTTIILLCPYQRACPTTMTAVMCQRNTPHTLDPPTKRPVTSEGQKPHQQGRINLPRRHGTHRPLGTNEATLCDRDTFSKHKTIIHQCEEVGQRSRNAACCGSITPAAPESCASKNRKPDLRWEKKLSLP